MPECELTEGCIFFNGKMAAMPSMTNMYKQRYCRQDFSACARYQVAQAIGRENVPKALYPNDGDKVTAIVEKVESV